MPFSQNKQLVYFHGKWGVSPRISYINNQLIVYHTDKQLVYSWKKIYLLKDFLDKQLVNCCLYFYLLLSLLFLNYQQLVYLKRAGDLNA